jgi:hypothetical protein
MNDNIHDIDVHDAALALHWPLRLAQQAFAGLFEEEGRVRSFRTPAAHALARARLSALSVDDRGLLDRWLSLQLGSTHARRRAQGLSVLNAIDLRLAAAVRKRLPQAQASLGHTPIGASAAA